MQNIICALCTVVSDSLQPQGLQPTRFLCPWDFPGKNTGMGYHFLLQGIFLTQGSNLDLLHLLHWQANSLPLCHLGSSFYLKETVYTPGTSLVSQMVKNWPAMQKIWVKYIQRPEAKMCLKSVIDGEERQCWVTNQSLP